MDGGAWWATVNGVEKSRTRLSDFPSLYIQFASILMRIFVSMFISDVGLYFSFCVCGIFVWFWYQGDGGFMK